MERTTALQLHGIKKGFFGVEVLHSISFDVRQGEVYGLCGENGAGKSTLMNVIGGIYQPEAGSMEILGKPYKPSNARDARIAGISFIHQELNLFSNLSVAENLFIEEPLKNGSGALDFKRMYEEAEKHLNALGIHQDPKVIVDTLPMGVQQTVEIAKALLSEAKIILFDEPTTSLSTKEKEQLFEIIRQLKAEGRAIIYISHILEDVFELCDRISVLRDGAIIDTYDSDKVTKGELVSAMVGRKLENLYPVVEKNIGDVLLEVKGVEALALCKNVSFRLSKGEILGIYGLMGAGRTEFARVLFGMDELVSGVIMFDGQEYPKPTPGESIKRGMAFITEDRKSEGLLLSKPVEDNIILVTLKDIANGLGVVSRKKTEEISDEIIRDLKVKVADKKMQLASNLSGGNQQKIVIGKWLLKKPKLLIMDEPTRGVDVGAKYEIYSLIQKLAKEGSGVLVISSEIEELQGICDRILVMKNGMIAGETMKSEFDATTIMNIALKKEEETA